MFNKYLLRTHCKIDIILCIVKNILFKHVLNPERKQPQKKIMGISMYEKLSF